MRQLIRNEPLQTLQLIHPEQAITSPTAAEMLRIKAVLILRRNATRDSIDFVALAGHLGDEAVAPALQSFALPAGQRRIAPAAVAAATGQRHALRPERNQPVLIQAPDAASTPPRPGTTGRATPPPHRFATITPQLTLPVHEI